jgi:hypothetical protein
MGRRFGQDRSDSTGALPTSSNKNQESSMKALFSALALLSFVAASTLPFVTTPAQAQTSTTKTTKKASTKKKTTKKSTAKKKTAKKKKAPAKSAS